MNKVWQENQWITTAYSVDYSGQAAIKGIGFKVMPQGEERHLIGTFQDKNQFGAKFQIRISDESATKL